MVSGLLRGAHRRGALRLAGLLLAVLGATAIGYVVLSGSDDESSGEPAGPAAGTAAAVARADCATGGPGAARVSPKNDAVLGPLVLIGVRYAGAHRPDAFNGQGYKIPVSLRAGTTATLSVPGASRRHVGLVFSLDAQERAVARGVQGADRSVLFVACPAEGRAGRRTGWPGGFVVDRRRCATLLVTVAGRAPERHRAPLGRRC